MWSTVPMQKKLAVVLPAYNEADGIIQFYDALTGVLDGLPEYECQLLFVDDGSTDQTAAVLQQVAAQDDRVSVVRFSRNFGHQAALIAGIDHAPPDHAILMMDTDMQHPPSLIPTLIAEYEKGCDVVYTVRENADDVSRLRKAAGNFFYMIVNMVADIPIQRNASDFRIISAQVAQALREKFHERNLFLRGIVSWVGFTQCGIPYKAQNRLAGKSKYSLKRNIQFATFGIISFSKKPLRAAMVVGFLSSLFGFLFAGYTVWQYFSDASLVPGWATLAVLLSIFGGVQLFFMGVMGEYIGAIFDEVKGRPHYLVQSVVGRVARHE